MAERNFDEEFDYASKRGHTFTLGGYEFHTYPAPPAAAFMENLRGMIGNIRFLRRVVVPQDRANLERVLEVPDSSARLLDAAPDLLQAATVVLGAHVGGDADALSVAVGDLRDVVEKAAVAEEPSGVMVSGPQIDALVEWLIEEYIGRPTKSPSSSGNGAGSTSNGSKATSRKPVRAGKN